MLGLLTSNLRKAESFLLVHFVFGLWCLNHTKDLMALIRLILHAPLSVMWIMSHAANLWIGSIICFQHMIFNYEVHYHLYYWAEAIVILTIRSVSLYSFSNILICPDVEKENSILINLRTLRNYFCSNHYSSIPLPP